VEEELPRGRGDGFRHRVPGVGKVLNRCHVFSIMLAYITIANDYHESGVTLCPRRVDLI